MEQLDRINQSIKDQNDKLKFILAGIESATERIKELELTLSTVRSQLIDSGYKKDSLLIISIDNILNK